MRKSWIELAQTGADWSLKARFAQVRKLRKSPLGDCNCTGAVGPGQDISSSHRLPEVFKHSRPPLLIDLPMPDTDQPTRSPSVATTMSYAWRSPLGASRLV